MSVYAGPKIENNGLIFYIDGRNSKSNIVGKIKNLLTGEEKNSTASVEDGYFHSNYGSIEKFTDIDISSLDAITVNVLLLHEVGKSGIAFSINSNNIINNTPDGGLTSYEYALANTQAITSTSFGPGYSATDVGLYNYSQVSTDATGAQSGNLIYSATAETVNYAYAQANTQATSSTSFGPGYSSTGNTSYNYSQSTTNGTSVKGLNLSTQFELSLYADSSQIIATNKNSNKTAIAVTSAESGKQTQYSVIYRKFSQNSVPITIYKNATLTSDSGVISGDLSFQNQGLSLFNKLNSDFADYRVRSVSVYDNELDDLGITLINRLETNK